MEIIITITIIIMEVDEVLLMPILQTETDMELEMALEVQITTIEEAMNLQLRELEVPITTHELLQTILLEPMLIIQQELQHLLNRQEVLLLNQLRYAPTLQVLIPDPLHHLLLMEVEVMAVEVVAVEDLHLVEAEDK